MIINPRHIVISVFGSLGDLHPSIALGMGLQARGYRVTLATSSVYQARVEKEGLGFHTIRPEVDMDNDALFHQFLDPFWGPQRLIHQYLLPSVRDMYQDLRPLLETADFFINAPLVLAGPVIAEHLGLPWASLTLQPMPFFSAYDPPVLPFLPLSERWHRFGPKFWKPLINGMNRFSKHWPSSVYALQKELRLPSRGHPFFEGQFSPHLNLALFSALLGSPQADWPKHTRQTGFVFYDQTAFGNNPLFNSPLPDKVAKFLQAGEAPVIFTLGSSAVRMAGNFYETAIEAVKALGCRAICLVGQNQPKAPINDDILIWDYLPYAQLFPSARAIIHQGGAGTTAQAMRAGKPMIIVPYGYDQPDNAARMKRLGVSRTIHKADFNRQVLIRELGLLLADGQYLEKSEQAATELMAEDGLKTACTLISEFLTF